MSYPKNNKFPETIPTELKEIAGEKNAFGTPLVVYLEKGDLVEETRIQKEGIHNRLFSEDNTNFRKTKGIVKKAGWYSQFLSMIPFSTPDQAEIVSI